MPKAPALCSWSGGKDSCLAVHLAGDLGIETTTLVSVLEETQDRNRSHAIPTRLLQAQARQMGVKLLTPRAIWTDYEKVFIETLTQCRAEGLEHAVFGDIDLRPHRDWEEKVCAAADVEAHLPLWDWPRDRVVDAIFELGIQAICVCLNTRFMPKSFCGRVFDRQFIADLPDGVDACGENGEFHTFVTWAPRFSAPVEAHVADLRRYVAPAEHGGDEFWFAGLE